MLFFMDCYYRSTRAAPPQLGESLRLYAASRACAIEAALDRAERLRPNYFEVRDPSGDVGPFYNSAADQEKRRALPWPGRVHY